MIAAGQAGIAVIVLALAASGLAARPEPIGQDGAAAPLTLSLVATTDLHGVIFPSGSQGGLALFGGYLKALRRVREADGGAVLLVDSGDTFQGGIESDLSEGAVVIDAYNALGYTAATIGNHEFDFGAVDDAGAREGTGDRHGAIKARTGQARFPFLAANLIDDATGRAIEWPNVRPSLLVEAAGVRVGLVGVVTTVALRATLPANAGGLHVAPLAPAIQVEALKLRQAGADVVIVIAHAGGRCTSFDNPLDLTSCDQDGEIFQVATALPGGLVNAIAAGHSHEAVAHVVNGIAIVQAYSRGQAFARADLRIDRRSRQVTSIMPFPPRAICAHEGSGTTGCGRSELSAASAPVAPARYEGQSIEPDQAIDAAMAPALAGVRATQAALLGVTLTTPLLRDGIEPPLGNLFADALLARSAGADVAITNNRIGGLRADLAAGPLTFGRLYDVFPFDNRIVRLTLTGADLKRVMIDEIGRGRPGALAMAGLRVRATCVDGRISVALFRGSGRQVADDERLIVATVDSLAAGVVFAAVRPPGPLTVGEEAPLLREVIEQWFRHQSGPLTVEQFSNGSEPRWEYPNCVSELRLARSGRRSLFGRLAGFSRSRRTA